MYVCLEHNPESTFYLGILCLINFSVYVFKYLVHFTKYFMISFHLDSA